MANVSFSRFNAAAHFVVGLKTWATTNRVEVYPLVIPGGVERYPFVSVVTTGVRSNSETKDGGPEYLSVDVEVTVAVKEKPSKGSGQELVARMADEIVDIMDNTTGTHANFKVTKCEWLSGSPDYDEQRAAYIVDMVFSLQVEKV